MAYDAGRERTERLGERHGAEPLLCRPAAAVHAPPPAATAKPPPTAARLASRRRFPWPG